MVLLAVLCVSSNGQDIPATKCQLQARLEVGHQTEASGTSSVGSKSKAGLQPSKEGSSCFLTHDSDDHSYHDRYLHEKEVNAVQKRLLLLVAAQPSVGCTYK